MNYIAWIWHNRSNFVFVPQGNTLMSGTIRYNMQLAKPDEIIVRLTGLEPAHRRYQILSLARLPIPPQALGLIDN